MLFWLATTALSVYVPDEKGELTQLETTSETLDSLTTTLSSPDYGMAIVKMLITLAAFILLLFGTFWFLKRLINQRLQRGGHEQAIQVLEKRMLSPKTMLYLVEIEHKKILIAESHLEVKKVTELERGSTPRLEENLSAEVSE